MTGCHRGLKRKLSAAYRAPSQNRTRYVPSATVLPTGHHQLERTSYVSSSSVVSCTFSALCVYSTFRHHPHPLGTFPPNFISVATSVAKLAHGEKLRTQSITHPITHSPILLTPWEPKLLLRNY